MINPQKVGKPARLAFGMLRSVQLGKRGVANIPSDMDILSLGGLLNLSTSSG
jgi:hypothetical protein